MNRARKNLARLSSAALIAIGVSACGSSTSHSASSTPTTAVAGETAAEGRAAATAYLQQQAQALEFVAPGPAFNISALKDKTIAVVTLDASVPFVEAVLSGMDEAAAAASVKVQVYDAQGSTDTASQQIEQAIATKPAAIVSFGISFDQIPDAVSQANAAHIPVVGALSIDSNAPLESGASGEVSINYEASGEMMVAYAVSTTNGPLHVAYQGQTSSSTFAALQKGVEAGMTKFCPVGCSLHIDLLTETDIKTGDETLTDTEIARFPNLNWILAANDSMAEYTVPAVELADKAGSIRVGSINAATANLQYVAESHVQAVDVGNSSYWLGWAMLDRAMRAATGQPAAMTTVPIRLFDSSDLKGVNLNSDNALYNNVNYRSGFEALWLK